MKKFALIAIIVLCSAAAFPCFAENVSAENVSANLIKSWLSENYGCKIDDSGDIILKTGNDSTVIIKILPKLNAIRIYSMYSPYSKRSRREMMELANKFNCDKRFLRVAIDEDGTSVCDYYLSYEGGLNSKNLTETLKWFIIMDGAWCDFVINGGDKNE